MDGSILNTKIKAVIIGEVATDLAVTEFENKFLIVVTQFGKLGTLVSVRRDNALDAGPNDVTDSIFHTQVLLGKDEVETHAAARFICGNLNLPKPVILSLALKNLDRNTLLTASTAILELMKQSEQSKT